jgi:hypothetical protein
MCPWSDNVSLGPTCHCLGLSGSLGKKNCAAAVRSSSTTRRRWGRLVPRLPPQPRRIPRLLPCPDRGGALQANHLPSALPHAAFPWAPPLLALQERLTEEGMRKDRRNSCGLLKEIHALEKCAQRLAEAIDAAPAPSSASGRLQPSGGGGMSSLHQSPAGCS